MKQKIIKGFKFIQEDMKSKNGNHKWEIGKWYKHDGEIKICESGFHACLTPQQSLEYIYGSRWFIVEAKGKVIYDNESSEPKFVSSEMRLIKEILPENSVKILNKYKKPLDLTKLKKKLKDIPTKNDVLNLIKDIDKIHWFKPQKEPDRKKIKLKINAILSAFKCDVGFEFEYHKLEKKEDWDSAWDSARDSAWASAWASVWDSARASVWDSARASARASVWDSAWDSARDSAWDSARDSAWASEFELVKDLMKAKGYDKNPFNELLDLWRMGLYPVGVLKDKKFHIYYVPLKEKRK